MINFGAIFARLVFLVFLLPPLVVSVFMLSSLIVTYPVIVYMKDAIGKEYRDFRRAFLAINALFVILDVLYYLRVWIPSG